MQNSAFTVVLFLLAIGGLLPANVVTECAQSGVPVPTCVCICLFLRMQECVVPDSHRNTLPPKFVSVASLLRFFSSPVFFNFQGAYLSLINYSVNLSALLLLLLFLYFRYLSLDVVIYLSYGCFIS